MLALSRSQTVKLSEPLGALFPSLSLLALLAVPLASIVPLYLLFVLGLLPRYNWKLFFLSLRRTNVGLGSSFSNPLHHHTENHHYSLQQLFTPTTTCNYCSLLVHHTRMTRRIY